MLSIQALRAVALAAFLEYVYLTEGASLPPLHWSTIESSSLDAELATSIPLDARSSVTVAYPGRSDNMLTYM